MAKRLNGTVALTTGASSGIGEAMQRRRAPYLALDAALIGAYAAAHQYAIFSVSHL